MAEWHLNDLHAALTARGWNVSVEPGDNVQHSECWQLTSGNRGAALCFGPRPQDWARLCGVPGAEIHFPQSRTVYQRLVDVLLSELAFLPEGHTPSSLPL